MHARSLRRAGLVLAIVAVARRAAIFAYRTRRQRPPSRAPILGIVRETEIRIAPEISGRLPRCGRRPASRFSKGDVLAVLDSPELSASVDEAKAPAAKPAPTATTSMPACAKRRSTSRAQDVGIAEANVVARSATI